MPRHVRVAPAETTQAVGYIRVSTAREEMISPELQLSAIEDYCARRGYHLARVIEDLDATGRNFIRKGVHEAIEMIEERQASVVVVWKFSRFGRNRKGWAINLDRIESVGGRLESATEEIDTSTSTGQLTRGLLTEFAAFESDRIGEAWTEAHDNRKHNGLPHSGRPRFGYLYHRTTVQTRMGLKVCPQGCGMGECQTSYLPDPDLSSFAAGMFSRYNAGDGNLLIAEWLNQNGLKNAGGFEWSAMNVRIYMQSGFAAGLVRQHDRTCKCKAPQICRNVTFTKGAHQSILEPGAWEAYLLNRERRAGNAPRVEGSVYPYTGFMFHTDCNGTMTVEPRGKKPGYSYRCSTRARTRMCAGVYIAQSILEPRVLAWLREVAARDVAVRSEQVVVKAAARTTSKAARKDLLRQAQQLAEALSRLTVQLAKGLVPEAAYVDARSELERDQAKVNAALEALEAKEEETKEPPIQLARDLLELWAFLPGHRKRELLAQLVIRIDVTKGEGLAKLLTVTTTWGEVVII